jgi:hypothetical protein
MTGLGAGCGTALWRGELSQKPQLQAARPVPVVALAVTDPIGPEADTAGGKLLRTELFGLLKAGAAEEAEVERLRREVDSLTADLKSARREIADLAVTVLGFTERQAAVWSVLDKRGLMKAGRVRRTTGNGAGAPDAGARCGAPSKASVTRSPGSPPRAHPGA